MHSPTNSKLLSAVIITATITITVSSAISENCLKSEFQFSTTNMSDFIQMVPLYRYDCCRKLHEQSTNVTRTEYISFVPIIIPDLGAFNIQIFCSSVHFLQFIRFALVCGCFSRTQRVESEKEIDLWQPHGYYSYVRVHVHAHVVKKKIISLLPVCCLCIRCARYAHKLMVFYKICRNIDLLFVCLRFHVYHHQQLSVVCRHWPKQIEMDAAEQKRFQQILLRP